MPRGIRVASSPGALSPQQKRKGQQPGLGRLWWGRPAHSAGLPSSPPAPASRPRPLGSPVGVRLPGPFHPARLRWDRPTRGTAPPAQPGWLRLLSSSGVVAAGAAALQVWEHWRRRSEPAFRNRRLWQQPTFEGPSSAPPQPRVGRPRDPAASSRVRPPAGCSHVTGAGGGEPAHGEHLPGKRARDLGVWGRGRG